jgi:hypothetical protein
MARIPVFYSVHFDNDVMRVQQVRNMGIIDGDEPASANEWEQLKRTSGGVERWIDQNMKYRRCVVVLIGEKTYSRPWVKHEIAKAWNEGRGLIGVNIHGLACPRNGTCSKGPNPFDYLKTQDGRPLSNFITVHDPWFNAYSEIKSSLSTWVEQAVEQAKYRF